MNGSLSVSELNALVAGILGEDPRLGDLWVRGEISNLRIPSSGHLYFSLKDDRAAVRCVMFRSRGARLRFQPENGLGVLARGRVGVYERDGQYQLYVEELVPAGRGELQLAFEQLKERLEAEGLFRNSRPLPFFPRRVGVVTSPTGAALRDIVTVSRRRYPGVRILLSPAAVQGEAAAAQIAAAIGRLNRHRSCDVIIVARGGGSLEELWPFNEEMVARAIHGSAVPVVTGVGHETDLTIADLAADRRAPTPSAAAEAVVPDVAQLGQSLDYLRDRLASGIEAAVGEGRRRLQIVSGSPWLRQRDRAVTAKRERLEGLVQRLRLASEASVRERRAELRRGAAALNALSPLAVLNRGYSITRLPGGEVLTDSSRVAEGDEVLVTLSRGGLRCRVGEVYHPKNA